VRARRGISQLSSFACSAPATRTAPESVMRREIDLYRQLSRCLLLVCHFSGLHLRSLLAAGGSPSDATASALRSHRLRRPEAWPRSSGAVGGFGPWDCCPFIAAAVVMVRQSPSAHADPGRDHSAVVCQVAELRQQQELMAERERVLYQKRRAAEEARLEVYQRHRQRAADERLAARGRAAQEQLELRLTIEAARTFGLGAARAARPIRHLNQNMSSASAGAGGAGLAPPARSAQAPGARGGSAGGNAGSGHGSSGAGEAPSFFGACASVGGIIGAVVLGKGQRRLRAEILAAAATKGATSRPTHGGNKGTSSGGGAQRGTGSTHGGRSGGGSGGSGSHGGGLERGHQVSRSSAPGGMDSVQGGSGAGQEASAGHTFAIGDLVSISGDAGAGEAVVEVSFLSDGPDDVHYNIRQAGGAGAAADSGIYYTSKEMILVRPTSLEVFRVHDVVRVPGKKRIKFATVTKAALRDGSAEYEFRFAQQGKVPARVFDRTAAQARDQAIELASRSGSGCIAERGEHKGASEDEDGDGGSAHGLSPGRSAGGGADGSRARADETGHGAEGESTGRSQPSGSGDSPEPGGLRELGPEALLALLEDLEKDRRWTDLVEAKAEQARRAKEEAACSRRKLSAAQQAAIYDAGGAEGAAAAGELRRRGGVLRGRLRTAEDDAYKADGAGSDMLIQDLAALSSAQEAIARLDIGVLGEVLRIGEATKPASKADWVAFARKVTGFASQVSDSLRCCSGGSSHV
jgi:hypothetical protein